MVVLVEMETSTGVIVVMSITNPARGGPSKAATPLRQVRIPKAEVNNSRPSKSTKRGEVTATHAERDKPKKIQTAVKDQKSKQRVIRKGQIAPKNNAVVDTRRASTLGWSVTAPATMRPPVLKNPMREMRRAESDSSRPLCWVIPGRNM